MSEQWTEPFVTQNGSSKSGTGTVEGAVVDLRKILSVHCLNYDFDRTPGAELYLALLGRLREGDEWIELGRITSGVSAPANHAVGQMVFPDVPARQLRVDLTVTTAGSGSVSGLHALLTSQED